MDEMRQLFVRLRSATTDEPFCDPELRARIVADVLAAGSNLNDVTVAVLAARYGVGWEPRGRRSHPSPDDDVLALRVPAALLSAIDAAAAYEGLSRQDETLASLSAYYGLPFTPAKKRHGPRSVAA